jgi:hypothetical protein
MALRVPPESHLLIQSFLDLPDERIQAVLDGLKKAGSKFNVYDLAREVSVRAKVPRRMADGLVQLLAGLYTARERQDISLEAFLDDEVGPGIKNDLVAQADKANAKEEIEARWTKFRQFLKVALALEGTVGTAAKTGRVMTEHERIFVDARILTDVRPIFHQDLSEKPNAAVLVHMLRITTRDIFAKQQAEYFALDSNDIRLMKQLLDRAIKKEETLTSLMKGSGVEVLVPKGIF